MRVGIVIDPTTFDRVMCDHLLEVLNSGRHLISLVVIDPYGLGEKRTIPAFRRFVLRPAYRLTNALAKAVHIWRLRRHYDLEYWKDRRRTLTLAEAIPSLTQVERLVVAPKRAGRFRFEYPPEVVDQIAAKCDVLFLAGAGRILAGDILTRVRHGVLSFHPADTHRYKGRPGGFFEWINGEPELGITLQRLNASLDGGEIVLVRRIPLDREPSLVSAMHSLSLARRGMLAEGLAILAGGTGKPLVSPPPTKVNHEKDAETAGKMARYVIRHICRCLRMPPVPVKHSP